MVNYFTKDDTQQRTPTGTVTPTMQANGRQQTVNDGVPIRDPNQQSVSAQNQQNVVMPAHQSSGQQQLVAIPQQQMLPVTDNNQLGTSGGSVNYFSSSDVVQPGAKNAEDEDELNALAAMNQAAADDYRNQYKQAADVTQGVLDYLNGGKDKDEEPYKKRNDNLKKIWMLTDALRHLGNLYNVTKGATPQNLNSPVQEIEAQYQKDKAVREADRAARAKALQDKAKQDMDMAYKNATLSMKANQFMRSLLNDKNKHTLEMNKLQWQIDKGNKDLDLKGKTLEEAIRSHKANESLRRESNGIARARLTLQAQKWAKENGKGGYVGNGSLGKDSKQFVTPQGVAYTLSKRFLAPANVKTVYDDMVRKGIIKVNNEINSINDIGKSKNKLSTNDMVSAIVSAATSSRQGHNVFVYYGKRLGYNYDGGMDDNLKRQLGITAGSAKPSTKPQAPAKPAAPPTKPTSKPAPQQQTKPTPQAKPASGAKPANKPAQQGASKPPTKPQAPAKPAAPKTNKQAPQTATKPQQGKQNINGKKNKRSQIVV